MKKILIAGGSGFIGRHLSKELSKNNIVYCVSRNPDNTFKSPNLINISHDILDPIDLKVDEIYHLASPASPKKYQEDPVNTLTSNIIGSTNLLNLAVKTNAKILLASSSEVYNTIPVEHNTDVYEPRHSYIQGKNVSETLFFSYRNQFDLDIKIARLFNVYGPEIQLNDSRSIVTFILLALKNRPIKIYNDGKQYRNFCYITDVVTGLMQLMNTKCNCPIDIAYESSITIIELVNLIIQLTHSKSVIEYINKNDTTQPEPDLDLAKQVLNWSPTIALEQGLCQVVAELRKDK
jgi:UDP-glucuronate decarboxylase